MSELTEKELIELRIRCAELAIKLYAAYPRSMNFHDQARYLLAYVTGAPLPDLQKEQEESKLRTR